MLKLLSLQIACAQRMVIDGRSILTAIHKRPVVGPVAVAALGLQGDEQADLSVHGGLSKALYAYPAEHYPLWCATRAELGVAVGDEALAFGSVGENLTLQGLLETEVWVGDVLRFSGCTLRVTEPRQPCYKFNAAMGFATASKVMALRGCCGFYLAVQQIGTLSAGDEFELLPGPRRLRISEAFAAKRIKHLR